jgi:hypothetical protein
MRRRPVAAVAVHRLMPLRPALQDFVEHPKLLGCQRVERTWRHVVARQFLAPRVDFHLALMERLIVNGFGVALLAHQLSQLRVLFEDDAVLRHFIHDAAQGFHLLGIRSIIAVLEGIREFRQSACGGLGGRGVCRRARSGLSPTARVRRKCAVVAGTQTYGLALGIDLRTSARAVTFSASPLHADGRKRT